MKIEIQNYSKKYGNTIGVSQLSLSVASGSFTGFIGPNGAGKSTTIRLLMNLIKPDYGKGFIGDYDCQEVSEMIKRHVGYLPSEIRLYQDMNTAELVKLTKAVRCGDNALTADEAKHYGILIDNNVKTIVKKLDIEIKRPFGQLSFGNQKKVGILLCMMHQPKVLIMDEPTGGLDPLVQDAFYMLLSEAHQNQATILFSSHVLSEVARLCEEVAIIRNGSIIAVENIESLKSKHMKRVDFKFDEVILAKIKLIVEGSQFTKDIIYKKGRCQFNWHGENSELLKLLSMCDISDVNITDPPLEEIFKHYYREVSDEKALSL